jgi:hypothetical protein
MLINKDMVKIEVNIHKFKYGYIAYTSCMSCGKTEKILQMVTICYESYILILQVFKVNLLITIIKLNKTEKVQHLPEYSFDVYSLHTGILNAQLGVHIVCSYSIWIKRINDLKSYNNCSDNKLPK